ncbi:tetratricopeptide repeat protein [Ktedonospora formicarum]|uniref:Tetratrico peptide repeat group 5 domain-containing protein n=1 Tax=Ktedonospora formicarum TaxID=2778364 RepID=A0A8J3MSK2_9CHLR|nr:tetratricopeptide repeat protein [Ktedonospora formicarum]GHO44698.1 hypothetical protein KSX_28610 [Ktedonospora formicarum]
MDRDEQLRKALRLRAEKRLEEARALLLELTHSDPEDAEVLCYTAWTHDSLGLEAEAVPYYEGALTHGLDGELRMGSLLGLGSTYRILGRYTEAIATLRQGMREYPEQREFRVFLAMALYNAQEHAEAMRLLLETLVETTSDLHIQSYQHAIQYYAPRLDEILK